MTQATQIQWTLRLEIRTGAGEIQTQELMTFSRPAKVTSAQEIGLTLAETKGLLSHLQQRVVEAQLAQHAAASRPCPHCQKLRPVKGYQRRRLQTLFGTVEFQAPRFKACPCQPPPAGASRVTTVCPLSDLLPRRATPELERLQAELGAKGSFREAARTLATLLPTAATSPNPRIQVAKIMALSELYGPDKVARAIEDAFASFGSDYIANLLEQRERLPIQPGPLHLTRGQDLLEVDLAPADLSIYEPPSTPLPP